MPEIQTLIDELGALSYIGIFLVSILANVFIPVPEEIVLLLFGYISRTGIFSLEFLIPIVILGVLLGDIGMYFLSRANNRLLTLFYKKFFLRLIEGIGQEWVTLYMKKIIFFSRFMIQFRFVGPFLAGQNKVPFKTFLLYDFLAVVVYVPLYVLLGRFFHKKIFLIINGVNAIKNIVLVLLVFFMIGILTRVLRRIIFYKK